MIATAAIVDRRQRSRMPSVDAGEKTRRLRAVNRPAGASGQHPARVRLSDARSQAAAIAAATAGQHHWSKPSVLTRRAPMPYCEPHRTARDHIVDLEIMKLELRKSSSSQARLPDGQARTSDPRTGSPRRVA
jgi:hypothetical protein